MMIDGRLESLSSEDCVRLLDQASVGRIAVITDDGPIILPVNYRLVDAPSGPLLALRTRPGNVIEQAPSGVAFEIDGIDHVTHQGWSVLVRGDLLHAIPTSVAFRETHDPQPWVGDRDSWLLIDPWAISGRRLLGAEPLWQFRPGEYM